MYHLERPCCIFKILCIFVIIVEIFIVQNQKSLLKMPVCFLVVINPSIMTQLIIVSWITVEKPMLMIEAKKNCKFDMHAIVCL